MFSIRVDRQCRRHLRRIARDRADELVSDQPRRVTICAYMSENRGSFPELPPIVRQCVRLAA